MQEIDCICPILNLHAQPLVKNHSPYQVMQYLEGNSLRSCVLVVDAETVKDAYENLPARGDEYKDLLQTAVEKVGKKSKVSFHFFLFQLSTYTYDACVIMVHQFYSSLKFIFLWETKFRTLSYPKTKTNENWPNYMNMDFLQT